MEVTVENKSQKVHVGTSLLLFNSAVPAVLP
jgi:hypothetical protein